LLPRCRAELSAEAPKGSFRQLHGFLKGKTNGVRLSLDEIGEAITESATAAGSGEG